MKRLFTLGFCLLMAAAASAQVDFTPIFTQIKLEARADFDAYRTTDNMGTLPDMPYGFHGRYFNFVIGGPLNEKFSYFFRQRIVANEGSVSLFDNTDFLYLNYTPSDNWMIRFGKDALAVGGFEYDAPPINVLFSTNYWDNFYCFQPGVAAAYKSDDANQMLLFQVANSPYVHYGATGLGFDAGQEWKSGLLSFNLYYSGRFGHLKVLHSVNMFERPDHQYMNYIAIGHELEYDKWDIYVDFIHRANALDDWGNSFALVSCANVYFNKEFNIFVKGAYEQNNSDQVLPGFGQVSLNPGFFDCFGEAGHTYLTYGFGAEYRPKTCPAFRIHAFLANRQTSYAAGAPSLPTDPVEGTRVVENSLRANVGITWEMDIHGMLKTRLAKGN